MAVTSRRRRRWIVLLVLVGATVWYSRSRRSVVDDVVGPDAPAPSPWPVESPPDGSPPGPDYTIKGNASSMLFHTPSSPYYARTNADVWFRTPEEATAAGFTQWMPKKRTPR
jgi:hypothetical protein